MGPTIGHLSAVEVRAVDAWVDVPVVARVRKDPVVDRPRNGHADENRKSELTCIVAMKRGEGKKVKGLQVCIGDDEERYRSTCVR